MTAANRLVRSKKVLAIRGRPHRYDRISDHWAKQATSQLQASKGRDLEWYFAEVDAAVKAERIFAYYDWIKGKIKIIHKPALVQ